MINHSTVNKGQQRKTVKAPGGAPPVVTVSVLDSSVSTVANVGALIKGDFKKPNPWSYTVIASRYYFGDFNTRASGFVTNDVGVFYSLGLLTPSWDRSKVYNAALDKLISKVRGGLDLAVDIAEAGQTFKMLKSTTKLLGVVRAIPELGPLLRRMGNLVSDPRAHNVEREVVSLGKSIADKYLEVQFGWKPLLSTIYEAADESVRVVLNKIQDFQAQATIPMGAPQTQNFRSFLEWGHEKHRYNVESKQRCRFTIQMEVPEWDAARWSSLNPLSIAWELMPYSFVVDWLYDIGSSLRRLETCLLYGTKFRSGFYSELYFYACAYQKSDGFKGEVPSIVGDGTISASVREVRFQRTLLSSMPNGRLPTVKANLGSTQLLESAALLSQFLRPQRVWKTHQIV